MNRLVGATMLMFCMSQQVAAGPLFDSASRGDLAAVERLLAQGASIDAPGRNGETALMAAALTGRADIAALLLAHGADLKARNKGGFTPLHAAAYSGSASVASLLLQKGAVLEDAQNKAHATPLMVAADEGRTEVVELLISQRADLNTLDKDGFTPLSQAWSKKHLEVVRILKRHGATCQSVEVLGSEDYYRRCAEAGN